MIDIIIIIITKGFLNNVDSTCYPAEKFRSTLSRPKEAKVVYDGSIITSQGPGSSLEFSLKLVEILYGKEKSDKLALEMIF